MKPVATVSAAAFTGRLKCSKSDAGRFENKHQTCAARIPAERYVSVPKAENRPILKAYGNRSDKLSTRRNLSRSGLLPFPFRCIRKRLLSNGLLWVNALSSFARMPGWYFFYRLLRRCGIYPLNAYRQGSPGLRFPEQQLGGRILDLRQTLVRHHHRIGFA